MAVSEEPTLVPSGRGLLPEIHVAEIPARILSLTPGERLVLTGVDGHSVVAALRARNDAGSSALMMETEGLGTLDAILDHVLDDLAQIALERWPNWTEAGEASSDRQEAESLGPSDPWRKAAGKHAAAGRTPRFRRMVRSSEFVELARAVDPSGLMLITEVDPASPARAAPVVQAIEWCVSRGAAVVAVLPVMPAYAPPYDRILFRAHRVVRDPTPVQARFIVPRSRAHHASVIEQRLEIALQNDDELGPLFTCNVVVPLRLERTAPRVDFLWPEGRIFVELDGPEHRGEPKFGADRHRDYELLVAGYLVLRITNEQAETDLPRAVEKIRDVVRLRRAQETDGGGESIR